MKGFFKRPKLSPAGKRLVCCCSLLAFALGCAQGADEDWDIALLDTARTAHYLTEEEKNVVLEMNKVRNNPGLYARTYIEPRLAWFGGPFGDDHYRRPGEDVYIRQTGGKAAVVDTANALSRLSSRQPLNPSLGMSLAARDHTLDAGANGIRGHNGSDGSSPGARLNRYGSWSGGMGETISYSYNTARDIVIQLLISEGHRNVMVGGAYRHTGVSIGVHTSYAYMCTIKYNTSYTEK